MPATAVDTSAVSIEQVERRVQSENMRRRTRERRSEFLLPILVTVGLLIGWEAAADFFRIPTYLFPAPSAILAACRDNAALLIRESWVTTVEIMLGYLLSIAVGVPLALGIFHWPVFAKSVYP